MATVSLAPGLSTPGCSVPVDPENHKGFKRMIKIQTEEGRATQSMPSEKNKLILQTGSSFVWTVKIEW